MATFTYVHLVLRSEDSLVPVLQTQLVSFLNKLLAKFALPAILAIAIKASSLHLIKFITGTLIIRLFIMSLLCDEAEGYTVTEQCLFVRLSGIFQ